MKTKATRKHKRRIRGGGDHQFETYEFFRVDDLAKYIKEGTVNPSSAPYISDEDALRLKAKLPDKIQFIDDMLRAQAEKQKKREEELIAETQRKEEAARKNFDESVGTCTSYVQTTDKADCEEKNRGTYDEKNNLCHYTPVNVKSQRECAAMQTRESKRNDVYHQFQEKDHSRAPVIYKESFLDSFKWDPADKNALLFYLTTVSKTLNANILQIKRSHVTQKEELEKENDDISTKLYQILAQSMLYYLKSNDYSSVREILGNSPQDVLARLNAIPETMLKTWVAELKRSEEEQTTVFFKVMNDVNEHPPIIGVTSFKSFAFWLDTNKYPELRKRIIAEGKQLLQRGYIKATGIGGRRRYTKRVTKSRIRKHRAGNLKKDK
jgi:hypothetical protein